MLPFTVKAPSTVGTFPRSFSFGHIGQLDAAMSPLLAQATPTMKPTANGRISRMLWVGITEIDASDH